MSSQKLFHTLRNELTVVLGRAELLALTSQDCMSLEHCKKIKTAALKVRELLKEFEKAPA